MVYSSQRTHSLHIDAVEMLNKQKFDIEVLLRRFDIWEKIHQKIHPQQNIPIPPKPVISNAKHADH